MTEKIVKCPNCGAEVKDGEMFCGECGANLRIVNPSESKTLQDSYSENNTASNTIRTVPDTDNGGKVHVLSQIGSIILTENYVYQTVSDIGLNFSKYIFLKDISSITLVHKSRPWLIVLAILCALAGFVITNNTSDVVYCIWAIIIAAALVAIYFKTRKSEIEISAHNNQSIIQQVYDVNSSNVKAFTKDVIKAKVNAMKEK